MNNQLKQFIPYIETDLLQELENFGTLRTIPAGTILLEEGSYVSSVPIVLKGLIKVFSSSEERDLLLYYIRPGESCIMSFTACMNQRPSKVVARTEEDTDLFLLPADSLPGWIKRYPSLNKFLFALYDQRYADLLFTVDQLIFGNLEERLINYLEKRVEHQDSSHLNMTHHEVANDLGTTRVVVSRLLKKLELEQKIRLSRNRIDLL